MDENTTIEITQEEREQVLKALEKAGEIYSICLLRRIFVTTEGCEGLECEKCKKQIKDRLIAFVKQVPAKKNMKAAELADKLDRAIVDTSGVIYQAIGVALGYDSSATNTCDDVHRLTDAIRNLDIQDEVMQCSQDAEREEETVKCISLPKDKNGDPVDVGDVCFKETGERVVINRIYYYGGNNIFAFDTQDKKIKPSEIIKAKEPRNFYALKNELTHAVHYDTNLLTSLFKDIAAYMLPEIQEAEDEEASEV